jgi:hypothetical protein
LDVGCSAMALSAFSRFKVRRSGFDVGWFLDVGCSPAHTAPVPP